jgi:hypothetical protein
MHTVSENSEPDLARQRALDQFEWALRELAANLMRITRGAGKAHDVMQQMSELAKAIRDYHVTAGMWPSSYEFTHALKVSKDFETVRQWSIENQERENAERLIIRGALQIVASRLVAQTTQESAGHSEMHDGMNELARVRAEAWKARAQAARDAPPTTMVKSTKPRAKAGRPRRTPNQ